MFASRWFLAHHRDRLVLNIICYTILKKSLSRLRFEPTNPGFPSQKKHGEPRLLYHTTTEYTLYSGQINILFLFNKIILSRLLLLDRGRLNSFLSDVLLLARTRLNLYINMLIFASSLRIWGDKVVRCPLSIRLTQVRLSITALIFFPISF